jgi:NADPH:quinone reductase
VGNYVVTAEEAAYYGRALFDLVEKDILKIQIFEEYPFTTEGVQNAQRDLTGGKTSGKLVIKVA